jgi:hypothetical protein
VPSGSLAEKVIEAGLLVPSLFLDTLDAEEESITDARVASAAAAEAASFASIASASEVDGAPGAPGPTPSVVRFGV